MEGGLQPGKTTFITGQHHAQRIRRKNGIAKTGRIRPKTNRRILQMIGGKSGLRSYSLHLGDLLSRICFEIEASFKAILRENGYKSKKEESHWTMLHYRKTEASHRLSEYEVTFPEWSGEKIVRPFERWSSNSSLPWFNAYHAYKHDRVSKLKCANFENVIHAFAGLFALICSQYGVKQFPNEIGFDKVWRDHEPRKGIGNYLEIVFPQNWDDAEKYVFAPDDERLVNAEFFQQYDYNGADSK